MKTAIILGATGLTGGFLLQELLRNKNYEKVKLFNRHSVAVKHPKIEEYLVDLFQLEDHRNEFKADVVFCCIGTTKDKTPDEETYRRIDLGIPVTAAQLAWENNVPTFIVISALGADKKSKMFYNRTKGEMEEQVMARRVKNTFIFRPSLIAGDRVESRVWENIAKKVMGVLNHIFIGPLKKYRSIQPETIAKAMVIVAEKGFEKAVIPSHEIKEIATSGK